VADDGLFPKFFSWADRNDTAWFGILLAAILPSLLMLWAYNTKVGLTVFTYLVDLTVVTVAMPYLISACAQLTYLTSGRRRVQGWLLVRDLSIAGIGALFSMWVTFASGWSAVYQAMVLVLAGVIIYGLIAGWRERTGQVPEPAEVAPADEGAAAAVTAPATTRPGHRHLRILGNGGRHTGRGSTEAGS
jgi:basic amino acid/polyamine antiporter, APA family